ncbi:UNVERIFIED_CONTAM: Retrovirus-related Pol polyprotein from transposon.6, partial [Sesamum angustifolium]
GSINNKTLKISSLVGDKEILILIDCGSTHCFIDEKVAMALGCKLEGAKMLSALSIAKLMRRRSIVTKGELFLSHKTLNNVEENNKILELLLQCEDVFQEPNSLPPERNIEHCIELLLDAIPKKQHPIDMLMAKRLKLKGLYLNKLTVKHNFPILVIGELLEELYGAKYVSQIELRSGYFQIKMRQEDIPKTSFITHSGHYEFLVMPFGLCNAPSTFQDIVNTVYEPYLRKFVLVFFDDIIIYSNDWAMHLVHLKKVLELLKKHQLYAKRNKCTFAQMKVEYLGHIISWEGIATDPQKVECMLKWPTPTTVKKNACEWNHEAEEAFNQFKEVMTTAPVLAMPDFSKPFIVETDASGKGIGVVLMQEGRPITYLSKALAAKNLGLSTYEKEFLALLLGVTKWRYYLQRNHFIIRTDQKSLKHILDQRIDSVLLQKWVAKLLGLSYEVQYKKGNENRATDALSRVGHEQEESQSNAITTQPTLKGGLQNWVKKYEVCQRSKHENNLYPGLLQPLPIPEQAWYCISMDFIEGLPNSEVHLPEFEDEVFKVYLATILARRFKKRGEEYRVYRAKHDFRHESHDKGADIDRAIKGSIEFGGNLISPAESGAVLGQLGRDQIGEGIGDFSGETYPN